MHKNQSSSSFARGPFHPSGAPSSLADPKDAFDRLDDLLVVVLDAVRELGWGVCTNRDITYVFLLVARGAVSTCSSSNGLFAS